MAKIVYASLAGLAAISIAFALQARAATPTIEERIAASRAPLTIQGGKLAGAGARELIDAVRLATYTAVGEDHGTVEIPAFVDALDADPSAGRFDALILETGPSVTPLLQQWIGSGAGAHEAARFERRYPGAIAFYTWRDEFALLKHARARTPSLHLIGIDQELMGAAGILFDLAAAGDVSPAIRAHLHSLSDRDRAATQAAFKSGNPFDFFMMSAPQRDLDALQNALAAEHDSGAKIYVDRLLESRAIYVNCCGNKASQSNRDRAKLMKAAFSGSKAGAIIRRGGRLLLKFGAEHLYRGLNPLHNNDFGNYVSEAADANGKRSVNILVLGVAGEQLKFAGAGRWERHRYSLYDADHAIYSSLRPLADAMYSNAWTIFDLRKLRPRFDSLKIADYNFEKVVFGYDFLVLIPRTTADQPLEPGLF